ncbi:MAG: hypothetical protein ACE5FN_01140 [Leptospirillia bacterium]
MFPQYAPQTGIVQTVKMVIQEPRFAKCFFEHCLEGTPEGVGQRASAEQAAALRDVLDAMIDHAAGAPFAEHRLKKLSGGKEASACALSPSGSDRWLAALMATFGELAPALADKERARIRSIYLAQVEHFIELCATHRPPE